MPPSVQIQVPSRHGAYPVHIGAGLAGDLGRLLDERALPARRIVVTNARVWRLHGKTLTKVQGRREPILLADGERHKTLVSVARVYDALVRAEADRATTVIAFGGGVVGDTAGFAAATYLRGVTLVQVPSTLLAQVDASVGGKVGVNLAQGKNLVGAFYPPALVVADPLLLATLPRREFRSGLYEVVKYGVIASRDLFDRVVDTLAAVFAREPAVLHAIVAESCGIKADVVGRDELEHGPRRVLNFGHTVGHALEAMTRYRRFLHGEAVALGMLVAAELAVARGALDPDDRARLARAIAQMGPLPALGDLSAAAALEIVRRDKKVAAGRLHVVLPTRIGEVTVVDDVKEKELERAMRAAGMRA
jgi:3-dehydroquinate synthase